MKFRFILFIILSLFFIPLIGQNQVDTTWDQFKLTTLSLKNIDTSTYYLVEFNLKSDLLAFDIIRVLDNQYAIVSLNSNGFENYKNKDVKYWNVNDTWKLSENIQSPDNNNLFVLKSSELNKTVLDCFDLNIKSIYNNYLLIQGNLDQIISTFLHKPEIEYIGIESHRPQHESTIAEMNLSFNNISKIHAEYSQLNGAGQIISVKDDFFNTTDIDLIGKYVESGLANEEINFHATQMATIIAGHGNSSNKGKGVSYGSKLTSSDYNQLFPDPQQLMNELGIKVQNHSYGTDIENFYGSYAEAYDQFASNNINILHIFSSGNAGESVPVDGSYKNLGTVANLTGNFKNAKNNLVVGAMDYNENVSVFSSVGPAFDGRIKPELVAFSNVGTSNATALFSGISSLIQQKFFEVYNYYPHSDLIKALLINEATDIENQAPDFKSGYGNINAYKSLQALINGNFIIDSVEQNENKIFPVTIPETAQNLKVTLVWIDPPAPVNSNITLMNDLNLKVTDPAGNEYLPWILNSYPSLDSINSIAKRGEDHLNNIEQVTIEKLTPGEFVLNISGTSLITTKQSFVLVYSWETTNQFEWMYPSFCDVLLSDEYTNFLRWENTFQDSVGKLWISSNGESNWQMLDKEIDLTKGYYNWLPEDNTYSGKCMLKMEVGSNEFTSDTFMVTQTNYTQVGLLCEGVAEIKWNSIENAVSYNVYSLQSDSLAIITSTADTSYAFRPENDNVDYYSVKPVFSGGYYGATNVSININDFDSTCYINSFYALNNINKSFIELFCELGSLYQIDRIEILTMDNDNQSSVIATYYEPHNLSYRFIDLNPIHGYNSYLLKVITETGKVYTSEVATLFYISNTDFVVFPNPAIDGVNVYSRQMTDHDLVFKLYNLFGKYIFETTFSTDRDYIELPMLKDGIYLYKIADGKAENATGKLVIQNSKFLK